MADRRLVTPLLACARIAALLIASTGRAAAPDSQSPCTPDPTVLSGTLPNGMRYFVSRNATPPDRAQLRLALRAGSVVERDDERGLAHLCEHLDFETTAHFAPGEIAKRLEAMGSRFGADVNATTGQDTTVYQLEVPTNLSGALDTGLAILADWAGGARILPADVDKERGIVLEELRLHEGAWLRAAESELRVLFEGSPYAERVPIGVESVIRGASLDTIRGFYRRWYRPELMAVVVVGAVDPADVERRIKDVFGALPASDAPREPPLVVVPEHDQTRYAIAADAEMTESGVTIHYKRRLMLERPPKCIVDHTGGAKREELAAIMLNRRLADLAEVDDPPFLAAGVAFGPLVHGTDELKLWARAKDGGLPRAAAALATELERARVHGFLPSELARAKSEATSWAAKRHAEAAQQQSDARADTIVRSFVDDWVLTSPDYEWQAYVDIVPALTSEDVTKALRGRSEPKNRVVFASLPKAASVPTVEDLRAAVEPTSPRVPSPWVESPGSQALLDPPPVPGRVLRRQFLPEVGVVELALSNGMRVVVKKTAFRDDEILLRAFAPGGSAALPACDARACGGADDLAYASGTADLTPAALRRCMAGRVADCWAEIGPFARGFAGSCRPADLEAMLQLLHARFARPGFRKDAFDRLVTESSQLAANARNDPGGVFNDALNDVAFDGAPFMQRTTEADVASWRLEDMARVYRSLFYDASEWTVVLVGNVDLDAATPLVERYLASLPTPRKQRVLSTSCRIPGTVHFPRGPVTRRLVKGREPLSITALLFDAPLGTDQEDSLRADVLRTILEQRLHERLRQQLGESYAVGVDHVDAFPFADYGAFAVLVPCAPDARTRLVAETRLVIASLRASRPTDAEVATAKALLRSSVDERDADNGAWLERLSYWYSIGRDPRELLKMRERIDRITAESIHDAARRWLAPARSAEVFLLPEAPAR